MQKLSGALDTEAHYDDELADLSHHCEALHGRCAALCSGYRLRKGLEDEVPQGGDAPAPQLDSFGTAAELRDSLSALARRLTRPPERPPPVPLLAEKIRREVNEAVAPAHSLSAVRGRLFTFFQRRRDRLNMLCSMITGRVRRYVPDWEAAQRVGPGLEVRLRLLQREVEAAESRLRRLKPMEAVGSDAPIAKASTGERLFCRNEPYQETTLSCVFKGDVAVCLREIICEDRATRCLRRFLRCMQHLPISHRGAVWRRAIELQAAVRGGAERSHARGDGASTPRSRSPPLPLKRIAHSEPLEQHLKELSEQVGCRGILRTDDGHAFARSVLSDFPVLFERQRRRMHFPPYPSSGSYQTEGDASSSSTSGSNVMEVGPLGSEAPTSSHGVEGRGVEGSREEEGPFRKEDGWLDAVLLQPRVELLVEEQRVLMRGAEEQPRPGTSSGSSAVGQARRKASMELGAEADMGLAPPRGLDLELREELQFLKGEDGRAVEGKLCELARERAQQAQEEAPESGLEDEEEGEEQKNKEAPEHLLRSYYLLRHLQGRALRRQLLDLLNLYRFAQQRLAHGVLSPQLAGDGAAPAAGGSPRPSAGEAEASVAEASLAGGATSTLGSVSAGVSLPAAAAPRRAPPSLAPGGYGQRPGALERSPNEAFASLSDTERAITIPLAVGSGTSTGTAVVDGHGVQIVHEAALEDLEAVEEEILSIGSHAIRMAPPELQPLIDKAGVLEDLLVAEVRFHQAKWRLLEPYLEAFEHVADPTARFNTAQRIIDVMAQRPRFDLKDPSLVEAYASATAAVEYRADLLKKVLTHQLQVDQAVAKRLERHLEVSSQRSAAAHPQQSQQNFSRSRTGAFSGPPADPQLSMTDDLAHEEEGFPLPLGTAGLEVRTVPTAAECLPVDLLDFCSSAGLAWQVDLLVEEAAEQLAERLAPEVRMRHYLEQACAVVVAEQWSEEVAGSAISLLVPAAGGLDILGHEAMDDPAWLMLLMEDFLRDQWTSLSRPERDVSPLDNVSPSRSAAGSRTPTSRAPPSAQQLAEVLAGTAQADRSEGRPGTRPATAARSRTEVLERGSFDGGRPLRSSMSVARSRCSYASNKSEGSVPVAHGTGRATPSKLLLVDFPEFAGLPYDEVLLCLYCNLLEHVTLRRRLADVAHEARALEAALTRQAELVGAATAGSGLLRSEPVPELENLVVAFGSVFEYGESGGAGDARSKKSGTLLAGDVESTFGQVDLSNGPRILVYCRSGGLRELRHLLQHELAVSWLYVTCAMHNTIILDPMVRRQALAEVSDRHATPSKSTPKLNASQRGAQLLRELRRNSHLSPPWRPSVSARRSEVQHASRGGSSPDRRGVPGKAETARLASRCAFPGQVKAPVWVGVGGVVRESGRVFRKNMEGVADQAERWRHLMRFRHRFLAYASIYVAERACDLAIRVQAAHAVSDLRAMAALMPDEVSPFKLSTREEPRIMVDVNGMLDNLFHLPQSDEVLALKGTTTGSLDFTRCAREQERKLPDVISLTGGAGEQERQAADATTPTLEPSYMGPSLLVLALVQELAPITALSFFSGSLGGDRQLLLRLHHAVGGARHDALAAQKAAAEVLDISLLGTVQMEDFLREREPQTAEQLTWDALQGLRMDFMNLSSQVKSLQVADGDPLPVLALLRQKRLCTTLRAVKLFRQAKRSALTQGDHEGASELSRWSMHLETGLEVRGGARVLLASARAGGGEGRPDVQVPGLGPECDAEAGGLEAAERLTLLARHGEPGASGLLRFGRHSHDDFDDELPGATVPLLPSDLHLLHPAARAVVALLLAGSRSGESGAGVVEGPGDCAFEPHCGRVPWQLPELPLQAVTRALCLLPPGLRERAADQHLRLEMQCDAYLEAKGAQPDHADSLEEEMELCQTLFAADWLRTVALCLKLKVPPPQTAEDQRSFEAAFAELPELHPALQEGEEPEEGQQKGGERRGSIEKPEAPGDLDAVARGGRHRSSSTASFAMQQMRQEQDKRNAVRAEIRDTYESVSCYAASIHKSIMRSGVAKLEQLQAKLEAKLKGKDEGSQAALQFVGHLRARGILVETFGDKGGGAWVYKEHDLDEIVGEMGHRLLQWACRAADEQHASARARLSETAAKVREAEQRLLQARLDNGREKEELEARLTAAVADRGWRQLFEVDRLHRVLRCTAAAAFEMEHRLSVEIQNTVLKELGNLDSEVIKVCGRYQEYSKSMLGNVQDELQSLRQSLLTQLRNMSASNYVLQQRVKTLAEDPVWQESGGGQAPELQQPVQVISASGLQDPPQESVEQYYVEIRELEWAATRLQTLHQLKFQQMHQAFEEELVTLQAKLSSNTALWEHVSEVRERQRVVDEEFSRATKRQAAAGAAIERLNTEVSRNATACEQLETWKERTARVQEKLEGQLQRYEREGLPNARKIERDLAQVNARIHQITTGGSTGDRLGMVEGRFEKQRKRTMRQTKKEEELTKKAQAKAHLIRAELERGQQEDDESLVKLAYEDYQDLARRIAEVEAENQRLKEVLELSGTVSKGLMAARSAASQAVPQQSFEERLCYSIGYIKTPRNWGFGQSQIDQAHSGSSGAAVVANALRSLSEPPAAAGTEDVLHSLPSARHILPPAHRTRFGSTLREGPQQASPDLPSTPPPPTFKAKDGLPPAAKEKKRGTIAALSAAAGAAAASASSSAANASAASATAPPSTAAPPKQIKGRISISESPRRPSAVYPRQSLRRRSSLQQHYEGQGILEGSEVHRISRPPRPTSTPRTTGAVASSSPPPQDAAPPMQQEGAQAPRETWSPPPPLPAAPAQGSGSSNAGSEPSAPDERAPRGRPVRLSLQPTASGTQGRAAAPQHLSPVSSTGTLPNA